MQKVIFFDFDGTLVDTKGISYDVFMKLFNELDFAFTPKDIRPHLGKKVPELFQSLGVVKSKVSFLTKKFYTSMIVGVSKDAVQLCCSIRPLQQLHKQGYNFVIVSHNDRVFITKVLALFGLSDMFSYVYGIQDFKTKDGMLKKFIRQHRLDASACYYVGDRFSDIRMARAVGLQAVAIHNAYGVSSRKELLSQKPDYIISNFTHLKDLVLKHHKT